MTERWDIVFLGGGLASGLQARYLKLQNPQLRILILDPRTQATHSPGESTVGVAGMFFSRDLGLANYLYSHHLPKNGLRYWFLPEDGHKANFASASEIGSNILPIFPTWQIHRQKLDEDLWELNEQIGITTLTGVHIQTLNLSNDWDHTHQVVYQHNFSQLEAQADWVIQSQGRLRRFIEELSPREWDSTHHTSAAWARYEHMTPMDELCPKSTQARVGYTSRHLSTNHIMGDGYWIWIIPLADQLTSVGIVWDRDHQNFDLFTSQSLDTFLRQHALVGELLKPASQLDFQSAKQLAHKTSSFFPCPKVAVVGDSAMFMDPFYSPGSDTLARQAHYLDYLISSEDEDDWLMRSDLIQRTLNLEYESLRLLYQSQYPGFVSYELFNIKGLWDFHSYTNRVLWPFFHEGFKSPTYLAHQVQHLERGLKLTKAIQNAFLECYQHLRDEGQLRRCNEGFYALRQNRFQIEEWMLDGHYSEDASLKHHLDLCRLVISELLEIRFGLGNLFLSQPVHDSLLFHHLQKFELTEKWVVQVLHRLNRSLSRALGCHVELSLETLHREDFGQSHLKVSDRQNLKTRLTTPAKNLVLGSIANSAYEKRPHKE